MSCGCDDKKEQYGQVRLDWGPSPLGGEHDMGGCPSSSVIDGPTPEEQARVAYSKRNMEQRAGNNPFMFEQCPDRLRYAIGTGCMNPSCNCFNCQGNCKCGAESFVGGSFMGHDLKFWLIVGVVAYFVYIYMSKRKLFK